MGAALNKEQLLALRTLVIGTATLPAEPEIDKLKAESPSASIQQLDGSRWVDRYIDGSGTAESPFAVLVRIKPKDSNERAEAVEALSNLADALEAATLSHSLPSGWNSIEGVSTPTLIEREETDGSEIWRAAFVLESARSAPTLQ